VGLMLETQGNVEVQNHGAVREISLNWPEIRNALGPSQARELRLAIEAANADEDVRAIVITAKGKAFCSGGNLPEILAVIEAGGAEAIRTAIYGEFQGTMRAIADSRVPVIAAVDGPAIGLGADIAMAGSVTLVGANGWLAQGWIRAGLIPATGGTRYVKQRGGQQAVFRFLAADKVDGPTAESWGLAIACDNARDAALEMAEKFASFSGKALEAVVQLSRIDDRSAHLDAALDYQVGFLTHPDFAKATAKLLGK